ncbi:MULTISPECIES: XdhC family protein [Maribacter]|uniref:XdhC family protein n=1 Tax=Maribacter flavus TaxID=1658664 RepID=A0ABU7IK16_9FLAO|nr:MULTISPECIES: XdhC family protein [Maribacter]MDC6405930.1 XdhC family protein [Maribacter sp. PR66]MEE1973285.1 XdhC family protein [Maribacter flavus]
MTHELKKIFQGYGNLRAKGLKTVLASVVALDGSSYRRPGVRMLISEDGTMVGAVSGGCVEKEVFFQAASVFKTDTPKMMTYDGRFRLGCEGILYILIEPFQPTEALLKGFHRAIKTRTPFKILSYYVKEYGEHANIGSLFLFDEKPIPLGAGPDSTERSTYEQTLKPCYKLAIVGGEHDAVKLSKIALEMGWEVSVSVVPSEGKTIADFPGIDELWNVEPQDLPIEKIDDQTALVLMTHSYVKDLKYLHAVKTCKPMYFGLLGPSKRREKLFNEYIDLYPDEDYAFFESIHGPAGINIGAEAPEEIAIAILSEILAVIRNQEPIMLKDKKEGIHN